MLYPVNLICVLFKLIPNWVPLTALASIVDDTLTDVSTSTPSPIVENFNLNGVKIPVTPVLLFCSNAPNLTLPSFAFAKTYQLLGNAEASSSNLILVGS